MRSRYRVTGLIKRGGMAEVYRALESADGDQPDRRIAIKRMLPATGDHEWFLRAFLDEARIASQLDHPNIVRVFDFGAMESNPFLAMELVDGIDLLELFNLAKQAGGGIPPSHALQIASDVAAALSYAHEAADKDGKPLGIIHRDVTPQNILVSWDGSVKLTDFGIALAVDRVEKTRAGNVKGKMFFMSPEQMAGEGLDRRSDLFSLGCDLHWMIVGRSPLHSMEVQRDALDGHPPKLDPRLPEDIARVVRTAIELIPRQRYPNASVMQRDIERVLKKRRTNQSFADWLGALRPAEHEETRIAPEAMEFEVEFIPEGSDTFRQFRTVHGEPSFIDFTERDRTHNDRSATLGVLDFEGSTRGPDATTRAETATDERVGSIFAGYHIRQLLSDAFGERLYSASRGSAGNELAEVAVFEDGLAATARTGEFRSLAGLSHPNVCSYRDLGSTPDGSPFAAFVRPAGRTLREELRRQSVRSTQVISALIYGLASGLEAAHAANVPHRRLSWDRIILDRAGLPVITRFSLAALTGVDRREALKRGALVGDPQFLAPEQVRGTRDGAEADSYALGTILHVLLTGVPPFEGDPHDILAKQIHASVVSIPEAGGLGFIAQRLLDKDYQRRPNPTWVRREIERLGLMEADFLTSNTTAATMGSTLKMKSDPRAKTRARLNGMIAVASMVVVLAAASVAFLLTKEETTVSASDVPVEPPPPTEVVALPGEPTEPDEPDEPDSPPDQTDVDSSETTEAKHKPSRPSRAARRRAVTQARKRLRSALAKRGLRSSDLSRFGELSAEVARLKKGQQALDPPAVDKAVSSIIEKLEQLEIGEDFVRSRLESLAKRIAAYAKSDSAEGLEEIETRYLDLQSQLSRSAKTSGGARDLLVKIARLEAELQRKTP